MIHTAYHNLDEQTGMEYFRINTSAANMFLVILHLSGLFIFSFVSSGNNYKCK